MRLTIGPAQHHEAATAEIACVRVDDRQGEAHSNRRVHGVASRLQDLQPRIAGVVLNAHHHGVLRLHGWDIR